MIEISRDAARALIAEVKQEHPYGNRLISINGTRYEEYDLGSDTFVRIGCVDNIWWKYFLATEVDRIIEYNQPTPLNIFGGRASDHLEYSSKKSSQTAAGLRNYGDRLAQRFEQRAADQAQQAMETRERGEKFRAGVL